MSDLTSDAFPANGAIPVRYTADGENASPSLNWSKLPAGTRELALVVEDPDAPRPEPFVHWVVYKIPPEGGGLAEGVPQQPKPNVLPGVIQGKNSYGHFGYDGPGPPPGHGTHHYHFTLYALDKPLEVEPGLDNKALIAAMSGHVLDKADLVGTYERPKR